MRWHFSDQRWEWSNRCDVKVKDRVPSKGLRESLGIDDIISLLQQIKLCWYGHVLRKDDSDWVKKCMECKMEGSRSKRTWSGWCKKTVKHMNREDAVDRSCLSCWHICFGVVYSRKGRISRRHTAVTSLLNCYHQKRFCVLKMHRQQPLAGPTGSRQIIPLPYHQFLHTRLREFDSLDRSKWLPGIGCSTKDELGVVTTAGV